MIHLAPGGDFATGRHAEQGHRGGGALLGWMVGRVRVVTYPDTPCPTLGLLRVHNKPGPLVRCTSGVGGWVVGAGLAELHRDVRRELGDLPIQLV